MSDYVEQIREGLAAQGIAATEEMVRALERHLALLYEANRELNLTSIEDAQAAGMHVLDSTAALPYLSEAPGGPFADLGSGAGFPGVPLALLSGRELSLVESVRKKAAFLERLVAELCLKATVHPIRAEELAALRAESFAAVTARALSSLPSLVELAAPLLVPGGHLICLKGRPEESEIERGDLAARKCGMSRVVLTDVQVPGVEGSRAIVVYERVRKPALRLPRRNGMAQRQPLA